MSQASCDYIKDLVRARKTLSALQIINGTTFYPEAPVQPRETMYPSRSVHSRSLIPLHARSSQFKNSFIPSSVESWNSLPESLVSASTITTFKYHLKFLNQLYCHVFCFIPVAGYMLVL